MQTGRHDHKPAPTTNDDVTDTDSRTAAPGGPDDPAVRGHLKIVVSKHQRTRGSSSDRDDDDDDDDDSSSIADEWKLIAAVMDRLLFVLFLFVSSVSSFVILVVRPLMKPSIVE